ncbi:MAG: PfkB family carbohydrate kinase [Bacilli bacterium]|nr:PfkB family carbohydrate kinase [Bacilli bacterium]
MKILCVGHVSFDITFPVDKFPEENTKNRINEKVECGGGPASNAAYLLGKYGIETYFMGLIGNDFYGAQVEREFNDVNVNTEYLLKMKDYNTTVSTIIANRENGSRTILTYKGSKVSYPINHINFIPDIILVDGQEIAMSNYLIDTYPKAITIIDAGRPTKEIIELSKKVKHVVCSKEFAEEVTGLSVDYTDKKTLVAIYQRMETIFPGNIVITLESNGCLYKINNLIKLMPSLKVSAVDSTGAGDLFHGAFTYGIAKGYDYEAVLKIANIVGALSVRKIGGRFSVPEKEEIKEYYEKFE